MANDDTGAAVIRKVAVALFIEYLERKGADEGEP
jgi:hypothetical protein